MEDLNIRDMRDSEVTKKGKKGKVVTSIISAIMIAVAALCFHFFPELENVGDGVLDAEESAVIKTVVNKFLN